MDSVKFILGWRVTGHSLDFSNAEIIFNENNKWRKKQQETLNVELATDTCKLHKGKNFDNEWLTFFNFPIFNNCKNRSANLSNIQSSPYYHIF